jgi:NAD+ kinase
MQNFQFHHGMRARLVGRNCDDLRPLLARYPVQLVEDASADFVICTGGDGSLLGAEREFPYLPKFAIRDRKNNPKCPLHGDESLLEAFFSGALSPRLLTHIQARVNGKLVLEGINDIVVTRHVQSGAIRSRLYANDALLRPQVISDGLVFCTAFGSTGYFQSITRGNFRLGIGVAYNNPMDGESFAVLEEATQIKMELLRGPALVLADNTPEMIEIHDHDILDIALAERKTIIFGLEAFRCPECYLLRSKG